MKRQEALAILTGVIIGCQLSTGCSTAPRKPATVGGSSVNSGSSPARGIAALGTEGPYISGHEPAAAPLSSKAHKSDPVAFTATQPSIAIDSKPKAQRSTRLINLFGEIEQLSPNSGSPFDGGNSLAQITFATDGVCIDPDVDRTGTWVAFASTMHRETSDIYLKAVNGKTLTQITTDPADDVMPAFSPDGKSIAFASNRTGNWDIYTVSIDGTQTVQITSDTDHELHASWSPDGKMLTYCKFGTQSQRWEIWTVDVANPGVRNFLDYGVFPQWCPDPTTNKILFQRAKQRGSRDYSIWTIDVINGQAKYPTEIVSAANAALINPAWSPDGSRIVFVTVIDPTQANESRPGQSDLWIVNVDGSERTSLTNGQFANFQPVWAGNSVYFVSDRSGSDNVWAARISPSTAAPNRTQTVGATHAGASSLETHP